MRLKSSIFLWVSLATVIPLTALILGITAYSERLYQKNVDSDIQASLNNIISELDFRLKYERAVIHSLATSPSMQQFFPVLKTAAEGDLHAYYFEEIDKLNLFLAGFQHSVPGLDTVRVLDTDGNTLVKVRFGKHLPALFEGMEDVPYAEEELRDEKFLHWMHQIEPYTLVYGQLPLSRRDFEAGQELGLLNSIVPLADDQQLIGFLSARALGDQLDRILEILPRNHHFRVNIVELNRANPQRHGMLLYSDQHNIRFNQPHEPDVKLHSYVSDSLWQYIQADTSGTFSQVQTPHHYYFSSFNPYNHPDISWEVILQLDDQHLSAPFQSIRMGLLAFALLALGISLLLANLGARHIAQPISRFAETLKHYADGKEALTTHLPKSSEEIQQLDQSFHYLVDTLETTQSERDRAQNMMLQNAKLASIGEMAAGIGHEINNPLNNILSYTKLIERDMPESNQAIKEDLTGLRNEALRAGRIVKGILNFARQVPPEYTRFRLDEWLKDSLLLVEPEAHKRHVHTELLASPDLMLEGDRQQLQQVLVNLLMNAIQASEQGQSVRISAEEAPHNHIRILVADSGKGISNDVKDKLFDPFFSTKTVGEGSGLGLSISLGIIQYHQGDLTLQNNNNGGVDAIIMLPMTNTNTNHD